MFISTEKVVYFIDYKTVSLSHEKEVNVELTFRPKRHFGWKRRNQHQVVTLVDMLDTNL